jgi:hypothetical protein
MYVRALNEFLLVTNSLVIERLLCWRIWRVSTTGDSNRGLSQRSSSSKHYIGDVPLELFQKSGAGIESFADDVEVMAAEMQIPL